jgi:hypothetical protein
LLPKVPESPRGLCGLLRGVCGPPGPLAVQRVWALRMKAPGTVPSRSLPAIPVGQAHLPGSRSRTTWIPPAARRAPIFGASHWYRALSDHTHSDSRLGRSHPRRGAAKAPLAYHFPLCGLVVRMPRSISPAPGSYTRGEGTSPALSNTSVDTSQDVPLRGRGEVRVSHRRDRELTGTCLHTIPPVRAPRPCVAGPELSETVCRGGAQEGVSGRFGPVSGGVWSQP